MSNTLKTYLRLMLDLLKTIGISFVIFFLSVNLIRACLEGNNDKYVQDVVLGVLFHPFFAVSFYLMHAKKSAEDYSLIMSEERYSLVTDIKKIMKGEGKTLLILYGILAVIFAISGLIPVEGGNFVLTILSFIFPIYFIIQNTIPAAILGWIITSMISILVIAYSHKRVHTLKEKGKL